MPPLRRKAFVELPAELYQGFDPIAQAAYQIGLAALNAVIRQQIPKKLIRFAFEAITEQETVQPLTPSVGVVGREVPAIFIGTIESPTDPDPINHLGDRGQIGRLETEAVA